nr:hypothetical protein Iba_chr04aCG1130 [Ipomoea batatas]GMC85403.1 hypothetical protein Iba_chr04dCG1090 [Ipomoea batatas]GMC87575.1 hypothetical protein Iba_chr04eCG1760 [Ipomoea batatas]
MALGVEITEQLVLVGECIHQPRSSLVFRVWDVSKGNTSNVNVNFSWVNPEGIVQEGRTVMFVSNSEVIDCIV